MFWFDVSSGSLSAAAAIDPTSTTARSLGPAGDPVLAPTHYLESSS